MITPGELWFGRTAGTRVRLSSRRICRGGALSPPAVHGLMDVLYGPTDMSARTRSVAEGTTGGHTGPPLRDHRSAQPPQRGGTEPAPYRCAAGSTQQRADVPRAWLPPAKFRNGIWGVSHRHRPLRPAEGGRGTARRVVVPYGWLRRAAAIALGSGAQRSVCASGGEGWAGIAAEITPKVSSNLGQSLSQPAADSSLYTREPWDGDADCRVGPAGLLAMTTAFCHSEAGAHTGRGNPSFYDGRGCGPPRSSAPTEGLPKSQQRADVPKAWPPPTKFRAEIWGVSHRHRPLRVVAESCRDLPGSA